MYWRERAATTVRRALVIYAALPLAYVIAGRLGLTLAVPPGYATAVFVPAGIAAGAAFMGGAATLPGTFFGSLLLNLWIGHSITDWIGVTGVEVAAVIALASMLQAAIGGAVLRRVIGYPAALDNPRDLLLLLLLSPAFCLTSASLSLIGMAALGTVQSADSRHQLDHLVGGRHAWRLGGSAADAYGRWRTTQPLAVVASVPQFPSCSASAFSSRSCPRQPVGKTISRCLISLRSHELADTMKAARLKSSVASSTN